MMASSVHRSDDLGRQQDVASREECDDSDRRSDGVVAIVPYRFAGES